MQHNARRPRAKREEPPVLADVNISGKREYQYLLITNSTLNCVCCLLFLSVAFCLLSLSLSLGRVEPKWKKYTHNTQKRSWSEFFPPRFFFPGLVNHPINVISNFVNETISYSLSLSLYVCLFAFYVLVVLGIVRLAVCFRRGSDARPRRSIMKILSWTVLTKLRHSAATASPNFTR